MNKGHINCWLCEQLNKGAYKIENTNKTLRLSIYKEKSGQCIIQAYGEDILQQEITYCPICR